MGSIIRFSPIASLLYLKEGVLQFSCSQGVPSACITRSDSLAHVRDVVVVVVVAGKGQVSELSANALLVNQAPFRSL